MTLERVFIQGNEFLEDIKNITFEPYKESGNRVWFLKYKIVYQTLEGEVKEIDDYCQTCRFEVVDGINYYFIDCFPNRIKRVLDKVNKKKRPE